MARYLGWLANSFFFVLCCFFAANTVNAVVGSALGVASDEVAAPTETVIASGRTWEDRQVILGRNLFNASLLAPAGGAAIEEDLEATRLPLTLLGTVAALEPENAWAAIEERDTHVSRVVKVTDEIRPGVSVLRIERRRVVLMESGAQRELALAEDEADGAAGAPQIRPTARVRAAAIPNMHLPPGSQDPALPDPSAAGAGQENIRNPATLFSQARILPKYENGQMVGVQVNAIKPGSLFETIGITNGSVIKELNGIKIDSPEQSAKILLEFVDAKRFDVVIDDGQGPRTLTYTPPN
jgi:general secretion pathway protein C